LKAKQKERYSKIKEKEESIENVYNEKSIDVLLSLKDYTNLSKQQKSYWLNFSWTLAKLNNGIADITEVQELVKRGEQLISDYWIFDQQKATKSKKRWDALSEDERSKFVSFLSQKRVEFEDKLQEKELSKEEKSKMFRKEIVHWLDDISYHETRGRIDYDCNRWFASGEEKEFWSQLKNEDKANKTSLTKESCSNCF
jgi:hypothetical protein